MFPVTFAGRYKQKPKDIEFFVKPGGAPAADEFGTCDRCWYAFDIKLIKEGLCRKCRKCL